jgi:hypothetical protein
MPNAWLVGSSWDQGLFLTPHRQAGGRYERDGVRRFGKALAGVHCVMWSDCS